ncbi:MAG: transcription termination/antitermination NusG family protein, partial [Onishia taeanensis]|uniref:transcription termination/antitermination NusG family protein n=1 Tax=Onishia taeanensis TaxID=284577 RepID=UPI003C7D30CB
YYLFIRLDRIASNWRPIRSTRGVLKLLTFGEEPVAVADSLIETLRRNASTSPENETANVYFRAGESVEIIEGPFQDLKAVFESQKGEERAIVLLNMLHKQQRLEMPIAQLRRTQ